MSYPLIQQPAPLQQLADVLQGIRARRDAQAQAAEERRLAAVRDERANRYLQLAEADRALATQRAAAEDAYRAAVLQGDQMRAQQAARQWEITNKRQQQVQRFQTMVGSNIRNNLTMTPEAAQAALEGPDDLAGKTLAGAPETPRPDVYGDIGRAVQAYQPARQGSIVRPAVPGVSGGVTYDPHQTLNLNLPSGGGGGAGNAGGQRSDANLGSLVAITKSLSDMEAANPVAAVRPWASTIARGIAGRVLGAVGGSEAQDAAANLGRTGAQTTYWGAAEQWAHNYIPNLPNFRMSVPMFNSVQRAFFPPPGEADASVVRTFTLRRAAVVNELLRMRSLGTPEERIAEIIAQRMRQFGADEAATGIENALRGESIPTGVSTPSARDNAAPYVDPRFDPRPE